MDTRSCWHLHHHDIYFALGCICVKPVWQVSGKGLREFSCVVGQPLLGHRALVGCTEPWLMGTLHQSWSIMPMQDRSAALFPNSANHGLHFVLLSHSPMAVSCQDFLGGIIEKACAETRSRLKTLRQETSSRRRL